MKKSMLVFSLAILTSTLPGCLHRQKSQGTAPVVQSFSLADDVIIDACREAINSPSEQPFNFRVCYQANPLPTYNDATLSIWFLPETPSIANIDVIDFERRMGYTTPGPSLENRTESQETFKLTNMFRHATSDPPNGELKLTLILTSRDGQESTIRDVAIRFAPKNKN